jgi:hypothetical protein
MPPRTAYEAPPAMLRMTASTAATERTAGLPTYRVQQTTKVEMAVNFKTAEPLGLALPTTLLTHSYKVIK